MTDQPIPLWLWIVFTWGWTIVLAALMGGYLSDWLRRARRSASGSLVELEEPR